MTAASIICLKKDVEKVLETLNRFGEFHIESTVPQSTEIDEYNQNIQQIEQRIANIDILNNQLTKQKTSPLSIFRLIQPTIVQVTTDNWYSLLEETDQNVIALKEKIETLNSTIENLQKQITELTQLKDILACMQNLGIDPTSIGQFKHINVEIARLPIKTYDTFKTATATIPLETYRCRLNPDTYFVYLAMASKYKEEIQKNSTYAQCRNF
jgi:vacuolar-type H+-ATPase subunit I/STV1